MRLGACFGCYMVCALTGASTAPVAVWIETSGGYDSTVQSCGPSLALIGQQLPVPRSSLLVSYAASLRFLCGLVLLVADGIRRSAYLKFNVTARRQAAGRQLAALNYPEVKFQQGALSTLSPIGHISLIAHRTLWLRRIRGKAARTCGWSAS